MTISEFLPGAFRENMGGWFSKKALKLLISDTMSPLRNSYDRSF